MEKQMHDNDSPKVTVILAAALLRLFPEAEAEVTLPASSINELLDALNNKWPGMRDRIADSTPAIRPHMNIFVDGNKVTLATKIKTGTKVHILTAISGG